MEDGVRKKKGIEENKAYVVESVLNRVTMKMKRDQ
jgi:hypothetical protein